MLTFVSSTAEGSRGRSPATLQDAVALGNDLVLQGNAFMDEDGKRIDPDEIEVLALEKFTHLEWDLRLHHHKWTETHPDGSTTEGSFDLLS